MDHSELVLLDFRVRTLDPARPSATAGFQCVTHATGDAGVRSARAWRCRELLDSSAVVPLGSDWPIAGRDPRVDMAWARLRREPRTARPPFEPEQRLTGLEALEGYTRMAARAAGEESFAGRIKEGFRADLTGFAEDPVL